MDPKVTRDPNDGTRDERDQFKSGQRMNSGPLVSSHVATLLHIVRSPLVGTTTPTQRCLSPTVFFRTTTTFGTSTTSLLHSPATVTLQGQWGVSSYVKIQDPLRAQEGFASHLLIQMLAPAYQLSVRDQTAPAYQLSALDHSQVIGPVRGRDQTFYFSLSVSESRRRSL